MNGIDFLKKIREEGYNDIEVVGEFVQFLGCCLLGLSLRHVAVMLTSSFREPGSCCRQSRLCCSISESRISLLFWASVVKVSREG